MKYIDEFKIENKTVLLRLDLNVTIKDNKILDNTKIKKSLITINELLNNNCKLVIMSHLGRIKTEDDKKTKSLAIVAEEMSKLLGKKVIFVNKTRSNEISKSLENNNIVMIENTRFEDYPDKLESSCDLELAKYWASLADIFVNDAFATSHRRHASTYGISKYIDTYYGLLFKEEVTALNNLIDITKRPFTVIMGGAKVDDKVQLIDSILTRCDYLVVGGGIANTFLCAAGYNIGKSLYSDEFVEQIKDIYEKNKDKIIIPSDVVVERDGNVYSCKLNEIKDDDCIYDIGEHTINVIKSIMYKSEMVFLNGTVGLYEDSRFENGTKSVLEYFSQLDSYKISGGGDAIASIEKYELSDSFDFISTGGGATLEYISSKIINVVDGD